MIEWSIILFCLTLVIAIGQFVFVARFASGMKSFDDSSSDSYERPENWPTASVILCVRGKDPSLEDCIQAVTNLDYPEFKLHIVLDHVNDPASDLVNQLAANQDNVVIHLLTDPSEQCSLKCSSIIQVISGLKDDVEIVALVDADSVPHRNWLKSIAAGLGQPNTGLVSGVRCYTPGDSALGSLIRYQWNSAAAVQMFAYRIPWGGTLALKMSTIKELDLLNKWGSAFCEDTMLTQILRQKNLNACILPNLVMPNSESCGASDYLAWASRQLLTVRLYNSNWPLVVAHAFLTTFTMVTALATLAFAITNQNPWAFYWCTATLVLYMLSNWAMLISNQNSVDFQLRATGQYDKWLNASKRVALFLIMPITQCFYFLALIQSFGRTVTWRQISYEAKGPFDIHRGEHAVYSDNSTGTDSL